LRRLRGSSFGGGDRIPCGRRIASCTGLRARIRDLSAHTEADALARDIDLEDPHLDDVAGLHHFMGVLHEAVSELTDVDKPVLVDANCPASAPMGQLGVIEERRISGSS
jgi:hypothetical protein